MSFPVPTLPGGTWWRPVSLLEEPGPSCRDLSLVLSPGVPVPSSYRMEVRGIAFIVVFETYYFRAMLRNGFNTGILQGEHRISYFCVWDGVCPHNGTLTGPQAFLSACSGVQRRDVGSPCVSGNCHVRSCQVVGFPPTKRSRAWSITPNVG